MERAKVTEKETLKHILHLECLGQLNEAKMKVIAILAIFEEKILITRGTLVVAKGSKVFLHPSAPHLGDLS